MEGHQKFPNSDHPQTTTPYLISQLALRLAAFVATLAAAAITFTCRQTTLIFGIPAQARYSYSPAYKYFAYANVIACSFSVLSLIRAAILGKKPVNPRELFVFLVHDLMVGSVLLSGCTAASTIGYIGKYGNRKIGWMAICDNFQSFCNRMSIGLGLSYLGFFCYLMLTVMCGRRLAQISRR